MTDSPYKIAPATGASDHWIGLLRKLVIVIVSTVLLIMLGVYFGLTRHERETLVSSKVDAGTTVLRYLSESIGPGVVFGDIRSVDQDLQNLAHRDDEVLDVEVWTSDLGKPRLVASVTGQSNTVQTPPSGWDEVVSISSDTFLVSTPIVSSEGGKIGLIRATFTLANVNAASAASTRRTLWVCLIVAFAVAAVLLLAVRQSLLRPLREMRMARELEIAAEIQRALLPQKPTHEDFEFAGRMVPADEVGGDFYDVHSTKDALWITVGDVSGHGLPAGLVMVLTQAAFAAHFRAAPAAEPNLVYRAVNELLWENVAQRLHDNKYVTCNLLTYRNDGTFELVGGHQSLLVYRAASKTVELLEVPGPWLIIMEELPAFDTHKVHLDPGDVLCLFSDGVIEARGKADELYDLPRLEKKISEVLGGADLDVSLESIFADLLGFCERPQDDASLLLVRRKTKAA